MKRKIGLIAAALSAGALALTACGASNTGGSAEPEGGGAASSGPASQFASCTPGEESSDISGTEGTGDDSGEVTIGAFNGWDESIATSYLMKNILESDGYTADVKMVDAAPGFTATAQGDIDVIPDVWLPLTHADYLAEYGDKMEPLGCWYDTAKLTIAVNSDSPAKSIADLKEMADEYDNTLVGIEPGAGETGVVKDTMIPTYGLEDMEFVTSSTSAMLSAIEKAERQGGNVVVTLWKPHWAYSTYDIRDLEDPEGAMGGEEGIWNFATKGFGEENPKAAQLFKNMVIPDDKLSELEALMTQKYEGEDPDAAVKEWMKDNPDFADQLAKGELAQS